MRTEPLFREQPYLASTDASILGINDRGGIILDRTIFYATSGGQPGDTGHLLRADGSKIAIAATVTGETKDDIIHLPAPGEAMPEVGETVRLVIDWERRYKLMRMHTACHLLSVICPFPITGASVDEADSRVDFDLPETSWTKEEATKRLMELVEADHPVYTRWISEEELAANPTLVKSKNVRPPAGSGWFALARMPPWTASPAVEPTSSGQARLARSTSARSRRRGGKTGVSASASGRCRPADLRGFALAQAVSLLSMVSSSSRIDAETRAKRKSERV